MIEVSPELKAALNAVENQPVDLYELYLDSGTLYYANQAIRWGGHDYLPKVQSRSAIRRFEGGEFDRVSITLSNVDLTAAQMVLTNEIEGRRLIIRKIDRTVPGDSLVLFNGDMERPSRIDEKTCVIDAKQIIGSIDHECPSRTFSPFCPFDFKGTECRYAGPETECDKSWSRCAELANTPSFGGFRFIPHAGTFQYTEYEKKRFMLLFSRKKKKTITASFNSVDDTPYDVPVPILYGRAQIAGIDIQHVDEGGVTKVLSAFCIGPIKQMFMLRANQVAVADWTPHIGAFGGDGAQSPDHRFPNSYAYNLLAYAGATIPSSVSEVDPAPQIDAVILGRQVAIFGPGGVYDRYEWSDNPVWCVRDFMTLPLAQGGMGLPEEWFDDRVNYEEAAYCDEIIQDTTNDQKIYNPPAVPEEIEYRRYRSTGIDGSDPTADGPYDNYEPGVDDDTSREPVPIPVKRFTMNVAIAKQEKAIDILFKKLLPSFRGYITFSKEGKIQIRVERPVPNTTVTEDTVEDVWQVPCAIPETFAVGDQVLVSPMTANAEVLTVGQVGADRLQFTTQTQFPHSVGDQILKVAMAFDDSNIVGSFEYPLSDRQPSANQIVIKYVDAPAGFEARQLEVNDYVHQAKVHKVIKEDLDGSAIDSYFQAWRIGEWKRAKMRDLGAFCSFQADIKASLLEIGDVIAVSAAEAGLQAVPFRVIELSFEENDEVALVGQLYSVDVYDDYAPQTTITVPAIFPAAPAPGENLLPGKITNIVVDPVDYSDSAVAHITGRADLPAALNGFDGCETFITVPGTTMQPNPAGHQWHAPGTPGPFRFDFRIGRPATAVTWRFWFVQRNEDGQAALAMEPGPDQTPYVDVEITARPDLITGGGLAGRPIGREVPDALTAEPGTRLVSTTIGVTPTVTQDQLPEIISYWLSQDGGSTFVWIGWTSMTEMGQEIPIRRVKPLHDEQWKVAVAPGAIVGDPGIWISEAELPAGAQISDPFPVTGLAPPLATGVTSLIVAGGEGPAEFPYNAITPDGTQFFSLAQISYDDSACVDDPEAYYVRITAQDLDKDHNPIGPEQPFDGAVVSGEMHSCGPLMGAYGTTGGSYTRTAAVAYVRLRVYAQNRLDQTAAAYQNPACATLQTGIGDGAGYLDVLVAQGGALPPAGIPASRLDPATIGPGLKKDERGRLVPNLDTPLTVLNDLITLALKGVTNAYLGDQVILANNMAEAAITAANKALAAHSVVDDNVQSVGVSKLVHGTVIFTGDVIFSRGSAYPVMTLSYAGLYLFSAGGGDGSAGLTNLPYVAIQNNGIGVHAGGTGAAVTISGNALTLWSASGATTSPYLSLTSGAMAVVSGLFQTVVSAAQIRMSYGASVSLTLDTAGLKILNGTRSFVATPLHIQIWSVDNDPNYPCVGVLPDRVLLTHALAQVEITGSSFRAGFRDPLNTTFTPLLSLMLSSPTASQLALGTAGNPNAFVVAVTQGFNPSIAINGYQVLTARQTGLGSPVGWADATALAWAQALYARLATHGLIT